MSCARSSVVFSSLKPTKGSSALAPFESTVSELRASSEKAVRIEEQEEEEDWLLMAMLGCDAALS
jgi:hypothetical protein